MKSTNIKKQNFLFVAIIASLFTFAIVENFLINETHAASSCKNCKCAQLIFEVKETKKNGSQTKDSWAYSKSYCAPVDKDNNITGKFVLVGTEAIEEGSNNRKAKNWSSGMVGNDITKNKITISLYNKSVKGNNKTTKKKTSSYSADVKGKKWDDVYKGFGNGLTTATLKKNGETTTYTFSKTSEGATDEKGNLTQEANPDDPDDPNNAGSSGESDDADPCYSGAGVLGHIICPLLKNFGELADTAYVNWIQPVLMLEPELVDGSSGTFAGWQIFQNFANIAFIIMLLIVVLSQVTGVGLSNYGIKKTLPKLIIAAILINLSYIICQLAVDLSNVLGVGLKSLMDGLTAEFQGNLASVNKVVFNADAQSNVTVLGDASDLASLALLAGVIAGAGTLLAQGMAVLLPLLLTAIAVVVGILFFFVLLSVRKAGVVLLVILSPIAFVCYMLPNTKKLFDRWLKAFSGLLLLFPICGLIIGGGDFASTILLNVNAGGGEKLDFFFALTAMIVGIVPIFFIPLLLKNSMSAMGNIGAKISGMGSRLSRGARGRTDKAVRNSDLYQGWEHNNAMRRAQRISDRYQRRSDRLGRKGKTLSDAQMRRYARNQAILAKDFDENLAARESVITNDPVLSNDINALQGKLADAISNNDDLGIRAYQNVLSKKGEDGREAVHQAMIEAENRGPVNATAARTYSANLMNNWASDYMSSNRSTFDYAKKNQVDGKGPSMAESSANSATSMKASNLAGTDEGELKRYQDKMKQYNDELGQFQAIEQSGGELSSEQKERKAKIETDRAAVAAATQEALANDNIRVNLKDKQRVLVQSLNELSGGSYGSAPTSSNSGGTEINIPHSRRYSSSGGSQSGNDNPPLWDQ